MWIPGQMFGCKNCAPLLFPMRGKYVGTVNLILKNMMLKFKELCSERTNSVFWQNDASQSKYWALVIPPTSARHKWANVTKFVKVYEANIHRSAKARKPAP